MKRVLILFVGLLLIVGADGCKKKHHSYPKVPPPDWKVNNVGSYSSSMTIVVTVPKELISGPDDGTDKVSAFIGGECRGVGTAVEAGYNGKEFFIMVHGNAAENAVIAFKYYCARQSRMYGTGVILPFEEDGTYGSVDAPVELDLHALE